MMQIDIVRALGIHGWMEPFELEWLAQRAREATTIIEVGSWKGRATRALADHVGMDTGELVEPTPGTSSLTTPPLPTVIVVDDWRDPYDHVDGTTAEVKVAGRLVVEKEWRSNLADHLETGRIVLARGHSPSVAPYLAPRLPGGHADFVFIDADHNYDGVLADILAYEPLVRAGGILAGHDYTTDVHPGVRRAVDDYFGARAQQGPGSIWWVRL